MGLFVIYFWTVLLSGIVLLMNDAKEEGQQPQRNPLPSWNTSAMGFLQFLIIMLFLYLALGNIAIVATSEWESNPILDPWRTPITAFGSQLGLLVALLFTFHPSCHKLLSFNPPEQFLNFSPVRLRTVEFLKIGLLCMLASLPLVWAFGKGWELLLIWFVDLGFTVVSIDRQQLLEFFADDQSLAVKGSLIFLAVIVAPVAEELVFRGAIYRYLKGRASPRSALIISSILFSLIHGYWVTFIPLFLLGMLLCRAYERSQNILVPISMHAFFNANTMITIILASELQTI